MFHLSTYSKLKIGHRFMFRDGFIISLAVFIDKGESMQRIIDSEMQLADYFRKVFGKYLSMVNICG